MTKYKLMIELLSDLCVSDGGSYNSVIDTDVCYDKYGFPYIPAKRIRGILRECAQELRDWDEIIDIDGIFGKQTGTYINSAGIRIGNAYLENWEEIKNTAVLKNNDHRIMHPQNILGLYTSIRSQTRLNYDTGVAEPHSLRTTRVINKGLKFVSQISVFNEALENLKENLEKCCLLFRHLGLNRTRGLGEVKVVLEPDPHTNSDSFVKTGEEFDSRKEYRLNYLVRLQEPMICKGINGEEQNSLDYIEGSKIMGIIASSIGNDDFRKMVDGTNTVIFSNAYISRDNIRYTEVPGYLFNIKNDKKCFVNKLYDQKETATNKSSQMKQLNQMKHTYVYMKQDGNKSILFKQDVDMEIRNHHRRPEDKSIGRALSSERDADFYQISSIAEDQIFKGYIMGTGDRIAEIKKILDGTSETYMGYSRMSEYGKVSIETESPEELIVQESTVSEVVVNLVSPAIIYNSHAMYSSDSQDLIKTILEELGVEERFLSSTKRFVKYGWIGGFNVTWNKRKPTIMVFDKGTSIYLKFNEEQIIKCPNSLFIGERNAEGYGECMVTTVHTDQADNLYEGTIQTEEEQLIGCVISVGNHAFLKKLAEKQLREYLKIKAGEENKLGPASEDMRATVSNMILLSRDCNSIAEVEEGIKKRYEGKSKNKERKLRIAMDILGKVEGAVDLDSFCKAYEITDFQLNDGEKKKYEMEFLDSFLTNIKYRIREKK